MVDLLVEYVIFPCHLPKGFNFPQFLQTAVINLYLMLTSNFKGSNLARQPTQLSEGVPNSQSFGAGILIRTDTPPRLALLVAESSVRRHLGLNFEAFTAVCFHRIVGSVCTPQGTRRE